MANACLNCGTAVTSEFCPNCGQKISVQRFSLANILKEDFIKGILEIDKGLLFTLKELVVRPGHAIREYVSGKRVNFYNYLTLLLLILAVDIMIMDFAKVKPSDLYSTQIKDQSFLDGVDKLSKEYAKAVSLVSIPLYALVSALLFRRAKQNFAEHLVMNSYRAAGELALSIIISLSMVFSSNVQTVQVISSVVSVGLVAYATVLYMQYFSVYNYSKTGLLIRSLIAAATLFIVFVIITIIYLLYVSLR